FASAIALVHSRFSTNTFPSWPRPQTPDGLSGAVRQTNQTTARSVPGHLRRLFAARTRPATPRCCPTSSQERVGQHFCELCRKPSVMTGSQPVVRRSSRREIP
ncbi:hypothetical protein ABZT28_53005, partial [Streptomyces sp. NPDC005388]|uniref:hypothetical protein n=1 Tax=Streptomyces sp. NPDC005388 TaxID=3156717 RepID=UPI0033BC21F5